MRPLIDLPNLIKVKVGSIDSNVLLAQLTPKFLVLIRDSQINLDDPKSLANTEKQYIEN